MSLRICPNTNTECRHAVCGPTVCAYAAQRFYVTTPAMIPSEKLEPGQRAYEAYWTVRNGEPSTPDDWLQSHPGYKAAWAAVEAALAPSDSIGGEELYGLPGVQQPSADVTSLGSETATRWRKKPVVIEARQFLNNASSYDILHWINHAQSDAGQPFAEWINASLFIPTLEGQMGAAVGDWIIRGVKGEFYPCKPDIFAATYEPVGGSSPNSQTEDHRSGDELPSPAPTSEGA